jgi:hypothetical protein
MIKQTQIIFKNHFASHIFSPITYSFRKIWHILFWFWNLLFLLNIMLCSTFISSHMEAPHLCAWLLSYLLYKCAGIYLSKNLLMYICIRLNNLMSLNIHVHVCPLSTKEGACLINQIITSENIYFKFW